jgi:hypothetical protein
MSETSWGRLLSSLNDLGAWIFNKHCSALKHRHRSPTAYHRHATRLQFEPELGAKLVGEAPQSTTMASAWQVAGQRRHRPSGTVSAAGLENDAENNCYLNAVIQALARLPAARVGVSALCKLCRDRADSKRPAWVSEFLEETLRVLSALGSGRRGTAARNLIRFRKLFRIAATETSKSTHATLRRFQLGDSAEAMLVLVTTLYRIEQILKADSVEDAAESEGDTTAKSGILLPSDASQVAGVVLPTLTNATHPSRSCTRCSHVDSVPASTVSVRVVETVIVADVLALDSDLAPAPMEAAKPAAAPMGAAKPAAAPMGAAKPATAPMGAAKPATAPMGAAKPAAAPTRTGMAWGGALPGAVTSVSGVARAAARTGIAPPTCTLEEETAAWAGRTGEALQRAGAATDPRLTCDGCKATGGVVTGTELVRGGELLAVQLAWPTVHTDTGMLRRVQARLGDAVVDLRCVYPGCADKTTMPVRLRAVVLFRASHFVVVADTSASPSTAEPAWVCIDDDRAMPTSGPWEHACKLGLAPTLLLYEGLGPDTPMPDNGGRTSMQRGQASVASGSSAASATAAASASSASATSQATTAASGFPALGASGFPALGAALRK